uniref:Uncharacterized protein n=1 Tax=viral metagenome TaxID=1070528 RepID=A0A6C0H0H8_9ZZZZ
MYFNKYLKYKSKYLDLKNFKSIKLFGGTITESDERLLNILEIDPNLIYDLKMVDADYRDVVKNLINKNIEKKNKENNNPLKVFKDTNREIIFISKEEDFKKSLEEFRDYLIKYNYFDNILKVVEIRQRFTITKEDIIADIDDNVGDITISIIKKINVNVNDIFGLLKKDGPDIFRIDKYKPVATLLSKTGWSTFRENYNSYTPEEKSKLNEILLSRDIKLYESPGNGSQFIFYSENYLLRLCRIFNIDLDKALNILSIIGNIKTDDEMYFIYCAFHNEFDIEAIIRLHKENKINFELYERFINE